MKLLTSELQQRFDEVGDQAENPDPLVIAKFFDPAGPATWYATEYDADSRIFYGYVTGMIEDEWGSFSLDELESIQRPFGLTIERDLYFGEKPISEAVPALKPQIRKTQLQRARKETEKEHEPGR